MFGPQAISLPPPFPHDHRPQHLFSEPARPQPSGQCHFLVLRAGSKDQRCACQGYQHNRNAQGHTCDCTHAACYHAHIAPSESSLPQDNLLGAGSSLLGLLDRVRKLEDAMRIERELRERERQSCEREIRVLREALTSLYKSDQDMQQKLIEIEDRLDGAIKDQTRVNARVASIESAGTIPGGRGHGLLTNGISADQRAKPVQTYLGPHDTSVMSSASEGRTSVSAEPMSPRQSASTVIEPESPRSSGILNLVEFPRPAIPRYALPPRLSPPAEPDEPRSSGFLALDVNQLIHRRRLANGRPPSQAFNSPSSSTTTKSQPTMNGHGATPRSFTRVSPPNLRLNGHLTDFDNRAYKKRKHQADLMALDVLADVSAASPVMS